ncbi:EcoAI/FtnUII family type I restriction enzme subunit R [Mycoplasma capricolum]|uniref:EcoAI/FtnUII family type I restriction enzme subunit R n=1 Tax=Mycoplasma capricolum TaxID=2095 RepID=UPI003DA4F021
MRFKNNEMSEEDVKIKFINPIIEKKGWIIGENLWTEYSFNRGKIEIFPNGKNHRSKAKRLDYFLFFKDIPLAVIEAKKNVKSAISGIQQAINYAELLDCHLAYSTNGNEFIEFDRTTGKQRKLKMDDFPSVDQLVNRYKKINNLSQEDWKVVSTKNYYSQGSNEARYYQNNVINKVVQEVTKGEKKRFMFVMATGTGKTFVAFQIMYKLLKNNIKKKVLFLADRNILIDQSMTGDFKSLSKKMVKIDQQLLSSPEKINSYEVYLSLYQQLMGKNKEEHFKKFDKNFFDLIIIDEAHRGSVKEDGNWREILKYFESATQIGMTATPKDDTMGSNFDYFGEPIYIYSLKQGIEDGFLAPYKVKRVNLDIDVTGYRPEKDKLDVYGKPIEDRLYTQKDYDKKLIIDPRTEAVAKYVSDFLKETNNRYEKTIFFCKDIDHAERLAQELRNQNSDIVKNESRYVMKITGDDEEGKDQLDNFIDPDEKFPTLVTTSKLLTTGVNIKTCKFIVIDSNIESMTEFKQIIGRGTRISEKHNKYFFTIIDFRNVTDKFADPDFDGASINNTPISRNKIIADPIDYSSVFACGIEPNTSAIFNEQKYRINDVEVKVLNEQIQIIGQDGKLRTVSLVDYTKETFLKEYATLSDFFTRWNREERKNAILKELEEKNINIELLRKKNKNYQDLDEFDLLLQIAYNKKPLTKKQRIQKLKDSNFLEHYESKVRQILDILIQKYLDGGIKEIEDIQVLRTKEFENIASLTEIINMFGGKSHYIEVVRSLSKQIYSDY